MKILLKIKLKKNDLNDLVNAAAPVEDGDLWGRMDAVDSVVDPLREFAKDNVRLVKRCHKPDRKGGRSALFRIGSIPRIPDRISSVA